MFHDDEFGFEACALRDGKKRAHFVFSSPFTATNDDIHVMFIADLLGGGG